MYFRSLPVAKRLLPALIVTVLVTTPALGQGTAFLYWADVDGEGMWRARLDGSQMKRVAGSFLPRTMATDLVNGKLYFAVDRNLITKDEVREIWRSDLDG